MHRFPLAARAILLASLLLLAGATPVEGTTPPPANVIVGFEGAIDPALVASLGGSLVEHSDALRLASVHASDPASFIAAAAQAPGISFAEANDAIHASGVGWDGVGWDGVGWDETVASGVGWDGVGWDGVGWDATGWQGVGWDGVGWDGVGWDGVGWDGVGWDGVGWDASPWNGSLWDQRFLREASQGAPGGDPLTRYQWGWHVVDAAEARGLASAAAVRICVVDSGIDAAHPDLAGAVVAQRDFVDRDADASDDAGHGTHVAGIAAARSANGVGIAGVSDAALLSAKVLDAAGAGTEFHLALALQWCVEQGARVVSMSLGTPERSPAIERAVRVATQNGVLLVAAAGNTGRDGAPRYPAAYPEVLAVAALMPDGKPAPFSTSGPQVDLAAPGYAIVSTLPQGNYRGFNGTSMAAPFVSGAAALMLGARPDLTASDVAAILRATAWDLGPAGMDPYVGSGFLDADAAVRAARAR